MFLVSRMCHYRTPAAQFDAQFGQIQFGNCSSSSSYSPLPLLLMIIKLRACPTNRQNITSTRDTRQKKEKGHTKRQSRKRATVSYRLIFSSTFLFSSFRFLFLLSCTQICSMLGKPILAKRQVRGTFDLEILRPHSSSHLRFNKH